MIAPLKDVVGYGPAFRTGAKLAVVDATGKMLTFGIIYPVPPAKAAQIEASKQDLSDLIDNLVLKSLLAKWNSQSKVKRLLAEVLRKLIKRQLCYCQAVRLFILLNWRGMSSLI